MRSAIIGVVVVAVSVVVGCAVEDLDSTTSELQMAEIHIKPGVGSAGDGGSGAPFDEIRDAVFPQDLVGPGTVIILHGGIYPSTTFTPAFSGDGTARVTVKAAPGETVTFDPGRTDVLTACFATPQQSSCLGQTWIPCAPSDPACKHSAALPRHVDEFISVGTFDETRWGTMLDSGRRLLSYTTLEDLRADNESDLTVPLSDPRPGFVRLDDPQTKQLYTYRGPGLYYEPQHRRIHVRLSHTHLGPEVGDYEGVTDPRQLAMSITRSVAATVNASFINFQDIAFENGAENTVIAGKANVTFERCAFRGGHNVASFGSATNLVVKDSELSALLGPWVSREDVKAQRDTVRPAAIAACDGVVNPGINGASCSFSLCDEAVPTSCETVTGTCNKSFCTDSNTSLHRHIRTVGACRPTAATLVITNAQIANLEIVSSEFRDGHDGVQIWGTNTHVHDSLFENLNDEAFLVENPEANGVSVKVHHNLIRSVLHVFNHDVGVNPAAIPRSGKKFFYRNIIDLRVPTLGQHLMPGDGDPWRFGTDFKMNRLIGETYYYQNTLVQADPGSDLSFAMGDADGSEPRRYLNNVHVTFDGNTKYYAAPTGTHDVRADGNLWSRRRALITADPFTPPAGTETNSKFDVHVKFVNVPDYGAPRRIPFENTDYRLDATIATAPCNLGVALVDAANQPLPDDAVTDPGAHDSGALPCGTQTSFAVGIGGRFVFPIAGRPRAEAGDYLVSTDTNDDGFVSIAFNAGQSVFSGTPTFSWRDGFDSLLTIPAQSFTRELAVGTHRFFLTLTDNVATATDMREVTIRDMNPNPIANLVLNPGFEDSPVVWTFTSGTSVATPAHASAFAAKLDALPSGGFRQVTQVIPIVREAAIRFSGWFRMASPLTSANARIDVDWLNATGGTISTSIALNQTVSATSFAYRTGTALAPDTAVSARVRLGVFGTSTGDLLIDDVRARIIDNGAVNGHFEDGASGWTPAGIPFAITTDPARVRSGHAALEMVGSAAPTTGTDTITQANASPIDGSTKVRASAWVKVAGLTEPVTLKLQWFNTAGGSIPATEVGSKLTTTSQFVEITDLVQPPPGAVAAKAILALPNTAAGTVYVDDVYVKQ